MKNDLVFTDMVPDLDGRIPNTAAVLDDKVSFSSQSSLLPLTTFIPRRGLGEERFPAVPM
jgi:hypothetical protein